MTNQCENSRVAAVFYGVGVALHETALHRRICPSHVDRSVVYGHPTFSYGLCKAMEIIGRLVIILSFLISI